MDGAERRRQELTARDESGSRSSNWLDELARGALEGWSEGTLYRLIVKGIPREFHGASDQRRRQLVDAEPRLTGTKWDALLAAVVEHTTQMHGWKPPAWVHGPARFLDEPWMPCWGEIDRNQRLASCPAAFIRHNTLVSPRSLDERGGDPCEWLAVEATPA